MNTKDEEQYKRACVNIEHFRNFLTSPTDSEEDKDRRKLHFLPKLWCYK